MGSGGQLGEAKSTLMFELGALGGFISVKSIDYA